MQTKPQSIKLFLKRQIMPEDKIFWCIVPLFCLFAIVCTAVSLFQMLKAHAVISTALCAVFPVIVMIVCSKTGQTQRGYRFFCLMENCALMPLAFVMNGGMHSGMPIYCLGGAVLGAFCVEKKDRLVTVIAALIVNANLFVDSMIDPGKVNGIGSRIAEEDILLGFIFVLIGMVVVITSLLGGQIERGYREMNNGIIQMLGSLIECRNIETGNHTKNIKELMTILLEAANAVVADHSYTKEEIAIISSAAVLHDIGKIMIPDSILQKPGKLTEEEFEIMKTHALEGCRIIETMKDIQGMEYYCYSYEICRHHHEAYDGSGYPDGISGDSIPFISQLASLADVYEALRSRRAYKEPFSSEKTYRIITEESKGKFSEDVLKCYRYARRKMDSAVE